MAHKDEGCNRTPQRISWPRTFIGLGLASLYTSTATLSYTFILWSIQPQKAIAQTPPTDTELQRLLEERRQRLQREGGLPTLELEPADPLLPGSQAPVPPLFQTPPTPALDPVIEFDTYRLGPGDAIGVSVLRFPDLSFQAALDLEGNITVPLLGRVPLTGLTLEEAQERIRFGLNRFIIDPVVTVSLIGVRPVQVTIAGEVFRPGFYPLNPPFVSTAILIAGGTTQQADLRDVRVRRILPDGSVIERTLDLFTPLKNADTLPDLRLQNGDAIVVRTLDTDDLTYDRTLVASSTLAQQQIRIQVLSYAGGGVGALALPNGSRFTDALAAIRINPDNTNFRQIALIRFDPERGQAVTRLLNARDAILGNPAEDPMLLENDVIVVGRNLVARITYALGTFTQPFRDILGFLLFFRQLRQGAEDLFGPDQR
ncbi:MAG: polysaccharide export protein [Desertifilum sp.]|nr:polysaccharide export protein [Desertifilum sp.]